MGVLGLGRRAVGGALVLALAAGAALAGDRDGLREAFRSGEYAQAYQAALPLARQGDAEAQFMLGFVLLQGRGVPRNVPEALRWLELSAEGGDPRGQVALGRCHAEGLGVRADPVAAYMWYAVAVESGTAEAAEPQALQAAKLTPKQLRRGKKLARQWLAAHGR